VRELLSQVSDADILFLMIILLMDGFDCRIQLAVEFSGVKGVSSFLKRRD